MDGETLEKIYKESLEERIIAHIAEVKGISLEKAMDIYYHSRLAEAINEGRWDVQYLDHKVLARILFEKESELFD